MPGITNGAELVRRLAESGTVNAKIDCARDCLRAVRMSHGRVATADEVVAALHERFGPTHMTVVKARALAETGVWTGPPKAEDVPIEEQILADEKKAAADRERPAAQPKSADPKK
jgi:hypothetical protein